MKKKKSKQTFQKFKQHTLIILKSLFSNQTAIDGARHYPWWVALIFFVLSICLPTIPVITSNYNVSGSAFMEGQTKGFDTYIAALVTDMKQKGVDLKVEASDVTGQHQLIDVNDSWKNNYNDYSQDRQYVYKNTNSNQIDFVAYYTRLSGNDFAEFNSDIASRQYRVGTDQLYVVGDDTSTSEGETVEIYTPNYILFGLDNYVVQIFNPNSITAFSNTSGDYAHIDVGTSIASFAPDITIPEVEGFIAPSTNDLLADEEYVSTINENFRNFFYQGYITNRNNSTLYSTLLTLGIYIVLAFFMGLMIFLLTRGKKNIMHILSFYVCQKINAWSMLCPAILGMILGFIFPQFAMVGFILFLGVRIMFMSFRQLRPVMR